MNRTHLRTAAVLLLALTAACGSKSKANTAADVTTTSAASTGTTGVASKGTGQNAHACDLITPADIQAALSATVTQSSKTDGTTVTGCYFQSADHNTNIHVLRYENAADLLAHIRSADANAKTVAGIGDDCAEQAAIGTITTTVGSIGIAVSSDAHPTPAQLEQIAKLAVDHFNNP